MTEVKFFGLAYTPIGWIYFVCVSFFRGERSAWFGKSNLLTRVFAMPKCNVFRNSLPRRFLATLFSKLGQRKCCSVQTRMETGTLWNTRSVKENRGTGFESKFSSMERDCHSYLVSESFQFRCDRITCCCSTTWSVALFTFSAGLENDSLSKGRASAQDSLTWGILWDDFGACQYRVVEVGEGLTGSATRDDSKHS